MVRRGTLIEQLRQRVLDGSFPLGAKIPSRRSLADSFGVGPVTMQRAIDRLVEQGFLVVQGRTGTFVPRRLPNRKRCAIVFGNEPGHGGWNRFWSIVLAEARGWQDPLGREFAPYFIKEHGVGEAEHKRLCADIADGGLSGMFFVNHPDKLGESPLMASPVPRISISGTDNTSTLYGSIVTFPLAEVAAIRSLATSRRRRLAVLTTAWAADHWQSLAIEAEQCGMRTHRAWWHGLPVQPDTARCARNVMHLLLSGDRTVRPDVVIIGDDNLVPHATEGIVDAGLSPDDVLVLAYANFPQATRAFFPCRRFGVDIHRLLHAVLDDIDRQQAGGAFLHLELPLTFSPASS